MEEHRLSTTSSWKRFPLPSGLRKPCPFPPWSRLNPNGNIPLWNPKGPPPPPMGPTPIWLWWLPSSPEPSWSIIGGGGPTPPLSPPGSPESPPELEDAEKLEIPRICSKKSSEGGWSERLLLLLVAMATSWVRALSKKKLYFLGEGSSWGGGWWRMLLS